MKVPLGEKERDALLLELSKCEGFVSSGLLAVESLRACARYGAEYERAAREWIFGLSLLPIDETILDVAAELEPSGLRSLDALHLATALSVRDEIKVLITYDRRLARAAMDHGLEVTSPA